MEEIQHWDIEKSKSLYGIENWGADYFSINEQGNIVVAPDGPDGCRVDLQDLVNQVSARGIELPVLFRFNGILRHRIRSIYNAFQDAITNYEYSGSYIPAYPIKVNQQRHIVDVVREAGDTFTMALEVGSKPELIAVLGLNDKSDAPLLCNGYKDESYIELALMCQKIGRQVILIIEKRSELELILSVAKRLGSTPNLGLRLRLAGRGAGRWERSGGDRAKFGLTVGEILSIIETLRDRDQLELVRLLHFHAGSQLTKISTLGNALKEAAQVYVQLKQSCPKLDYLDVGGGLGVDYDGSKTAFESSMNYTVAEYARDVVWILKEVCERAEVPAPCIITESGRASIAYHSILVCNVLGIANTFSDTCDPDEIIEATENRTIRNFAYVLKESGPKNCQEALHDALSLRAELMEQFNLGLMSIEDRARGERCYWAILNTVRKWIDDLHYVPEDLENLPAMLSDTYFCNFSIFQSLPDSWAIKQLFPITPVSRLHEKPDRTVVIADITCDSDGCISRFPDLRDVKRYLPAHRLKPGEEYCFATFLVGAYQEILGDLHNLFGDTNAVHVEVSPDGNVDFPHVVLGDSVSEVLQFVQFDKQDLCERWRTMLDEAVRSGKISLEECGIMFQKYSQSFDGYTYLTT